MINSLYKDTNIHWRCKQLIYPVSIRRRFDVYTTSLTYDVVRMSKQRRVRTGYKKNKVKDKLKIVNENLYITNLHLKMIPIQWYITSKKIWSFCCFDRVDSSCKLYVKKSEEFDSKISLEILCFLYVSAKICSSSVDIFQRFVLF